MFGILKKKLSSFVDSVAKAVGIKEEKAEAAKPGVKTAEAKELIEPVVEIAPEVKTEINSKEDVKREWIREAKEENREAIKESGEFNDSKLVQAHAKTVQLGRQATDAVVHSKGTPVVSNVLDKSKSKISVKEKIEYIAKPKEVIEAVKKPEITPGTKKQETKVVDVLKPKKPIEEKLAKPDVKGRELKAKVGIVKSISTFFSSEVALSDNELKPLFEELEIALLESDVSFDTTQHFLELLQKELVGKKFSKNNLQKQLKERIAAVLEEILSKNTFDLIKEIKEKKGLPFVVLFLGPNGAGKTTTIAKLASVLKGKGISCVISAADTFRAAAIEQALHHGNVLNVKVVKRDYGSDPASVAFDAIAHAKANNVKVVLIDTAGRQETSANLMNEMKKIARVADADAKVFVGESLAGSTLIEQVKKFKAELQGLTGIILTKIDCDAKGGNTLSIAFETQLPILFLGVGQEYDDLIEFDPKFVINNIMNE